MSLEAELMRLTLADVLNAGGMAELYSISEEAYPLLAYLVTGANRTLLDCQGEEDAKVREVLGFQAAAMALRAILLAARTKPRPAIERFLRGVRYEDFHRAIHGLHSRSLIAGFYAPIVREARASSAGAVQCTPKIVRNLWCGGWASSTRC